MAARGRPFFIVGVWRFVSPRLIRLGLKLLSGCRESHSGYYHPKVADYCYPTPRIIYTLDLRLMPLAQAKTLLPEGKVTH